MEGGRNGVDHICEGTASFREASFKRSGASARAAFLNREGREEGEREGGRVGRSSNAHPLATKPTQASPPR